MTPLRILSTLNRDEFVGRDAELQQITVHAWSGGEPNGMLLASKPGAGAGELLRQAYDQLFLRRGDPVPIHFEFKRHETNHAEIAAHFFQNLIQQYVAYRRVDPELGNAPLTLSELVELSLPFDYEFIGELVDRFQHERAHSNQADFVRFCFSAPHRFATSGRNLYHLINCLALSPCREEIKLVREAVASMTRSTTRFVVAALRRQVVDLLHGAEHTAMRAPATSRLDRLSDDDALKLVKTLARHYGIESNDPTCELIVQQLNGSPFFINELLQAAREQKASLASFLDFQRLYVSELMGGRLQRHFDEILDLVVPPSKTRKTLLLVLFESISTDTNRASLWSWKKRLGMDSAEFERLITALHVHELANSSATFIEVSSDSFVWCDYLRARHSIEVAGEARPLVSANLLLDALKRAPRAMAKKYRRAAAVGLSELLAQFNCQTVPASLFHYDKFAAAHKGKELENVDVSIDLESEVVKLPQIVSAADCSGYSALNACEAERCSIGHGFEAGEYVAENEVVWIAAEIDSKLEASIELTGEWCNRLDTIARDCGPGQARLWLVAPEGFSRDASELLNQRGAFGSSRAQVEMLSSRLESRAEPKEASPANEYEMVIPMGADTELIAAQTVEQIARRINFGPEAINQIKTALVEACINAAEHSLSPDRKIYQRFRLESDKLVVIVSSRGVVPAKPADPDDESTAHDRSENRKSRRGWGLKLIKTLMDEVEFERVDDGTQLRMTKYVR